MTARAIPSDFYVVCGYRWAGGRVEVPDSIVEHVCALPFAEHRADRRRPCECSCGAVNT